MAKDLLAPVIEAEREIRHALDLCTMHEALRSAARRKEAAGA